MVSAHIFGRFQRNKMIEARSTSTKKPARYLRLREPQSQSVILEECPFDEASVEEDGGVVEQDAGVTPTADIPAESSCKDLREPPQPDAYEARSHPWDEWDAWDTSMVAFWESARNKESQDAGTDTKHDAKSGVSDKVGSTIHIPNYRVQYACPRRLPPLEALREETASRIGPPSLGIFKSRLPSHLIRRLDDVIHLCEDHAANLPYGWHTGLYSLTKQDIAMSLIPEAAPIVASITQFILSEVRRLYGVPHVFMDRNQPHVLKYSASTGHVGVELHHDRCDVTANLVLSPHTAYGGGGTMIPALGETVRLDKGEFLMHPGSLLHAGRNITWGNRYLMVFFAHWERPVA